MCSRVSCVARIVSELHFQAQSENRESIQLLWKYSSAGDGKQFYRELSVGQLSNACFKCFQMCGWNGEAVKSSVSFLQCSNWSHSKTWVCRHICVWEQWFKVLFTLLYLLFHSKNCMAVWYYATQSCLDQSEMQTVWRSLLSVPPTPRKLTFPTGQ